MNRKFTKEYVSINGIEQFFLHYEIPEADVVIYLHGGPGSATSNLAYFTDRNITTHTMIYYDQRGAGKTLLKNRTLKTGATLPVLIADLRETIQYIKDKYQKDKVTLIGHSFGSILGTEYIKQFPEDILCYIGIGQVVSYLEGEKVGFHELIKRVDKADNRTDMKKIHALGDYPFNTKKAYSTKSIMKVRNLQAKYELAVNPGKVMKAFIKSPIFNPLDIVILAIGLRVNRRLDESVNEYDTSHFKTYQVPIYYVAGENDWQVPSIVAEKYYREINAPHKGFYWIKNAGHATNFDNPEDFNKAIAEILKKSRLKSKMIMER